MAHAPVLWQQAGNYPAVADRGLLAALWPTGGASGAVVTAVNNTMTVSVAVGSAAVPLQSGNGTALCRWDAPEVPPALNAPPPSGQSRIDLVICQVRDNAIDAGPNNDFVLAVVTGTPAASNPAVPATPANALALASVTVPGAAANLNAAAITDARTGGLTVPGVAAGRLYVSTSSNPPSGVWGIFGCDGVDYLQNGMVQGKPVAAGTLIVPRTGVYQIDGQITLNPVASGQAVFSSIYINGAPRSQGAAGPPAAVFSVSHASDKLLVTAGQLIQLYGYISGGAATIVAGPSTTFLSAIQIG